MAENIIKVNTSSLDQTRREVQAKLDKITKDIGHITEDMATLNSMWEGDAHQAFVQMVAQDINFLEGACDGIRNIIRFETTATSEYNKCEQQVADLISQIRI